MSSSRAIYLHIGLPENGTTLLHRILRENRPELLSQGLLFAGDRHDQALPAQQRPKGPTGDHEDERSAGTWDAIVREVTRWTGAALISQGTFAVARSDQVKSIVAAFPGRRVEVIVTVRNLAWQLTTIWQEMVKSGETATLAEYVGEVRKQLEDNDVSSGFWHKQDLVGVLRRWQEAVPAERTHLVTIPPHGTDSGLLWQRFAEVVGVNLKPEQLATSSGGAALGKVEIEFLRRLNAHLSDSLQRSGYHAYVKEHLVRRVMTPRAQSKPITLSPDDQTWAVAQSQKLIQTLATFPLRLHGDLADLEPPPSPIQGEDVSDAAIVRIGVRAITQLLRATADEQGTPAVRRVAP